MRHRDVSRRTLLKAAGAAAAAAASADQGRAEAFSSPPEPTTAPPELLVVAISGRLRRNAPRTTLDEGSNGVVSSSLPTGPSASGLTTSNARAR